MLNILLLERIDQFDDLEEAEISAVMLDSLDVDSSRDVCFAWAGPPAEDKVLRYVHELASMQLEHRRLVDAAKS